MTADTHCRRCSRVEQGKRLDGCPLRKPNACTGLHTYLTSKLVNTGSSRSHTGDTNGQAQAGSA